jgi:hypothetical protein
MMNKKDALRLFREEVLPNIIKQYGKDDKPAQSQAWNDFTDALCKDKQITMKQCESWTNPF